jgi:hypothetical protein
MKQSTTAKRNMQKEKEKSSKELENMMLLAQKYQSKPASEVPQTEAPPVLAVTPPEPTPSRFINHILYIT